MAPETNTLQDTVKGGSTYDIQKVLSNIKSAKIIIADMTAAMANTNLRDKGQLLPLQDLRNKVDDYVQILLTFKGEKKIFAEQIQEKNKKYDEQLLKLEKKYQQLEKNYAQFKKVKEDLEKRYQEANKNDPAMTELTRSLTTLSITYEKEVRQFIKDDVNKLKNNLESLKNDAKNHTPLEHQRKIEAVVTTAPTLQH